MDINKFKIVIMHKKDLTFPRIKNKGLKIDFSGGNISSDGGLIPVRLLDKKLGIISDISNAVKSFDN